MINSDILKEKIDKARFILVGIGEEFEGKEFLINNDRYLQIEEELKDNEKYIWILPYVQHFFLKENKLLINALNNLAGILKNKDYFIVTTCMNGLVENSDFNEERLVSPCGGFNKIQCSSNECDMLTMSSKQLYSDIEKYCMGTIALQDINIILCPECNSSMEFNSLYAKSYKESGYMQAWGEYTKWLQYTLNQKLCVLELGVLFDYPRVIRFPFEKIAFFNQKADFIRINERLYQLSDEIGNKGISHSENAVSFLNNIEI